MIFGVLGPLYARADDGRTASLSGPARRLLLAALIARGGRAVPAETLIEDVWGDAAPATARKTLQSHVVRLRRALAPFADGADVVVTEATSYRLAAEPLAIDASCFERELALGTTALAADDAEAAQRHLDAAVARWRGEAYGEFAERPFALAARRRLGESFVLAHERRFEAALRLGRGASLVGDIESRLLLDPYHERLWEQLMTALYRADRQADALAAYRRARETLLDGLGVEPGQQLRTMQDRVLAQDDSLRSGDGRADVSSTPIEVMSGDAEPTCPYLGLEGYDQSDCAVFVAREALTARLVARLQSTALLVITGDSGAGKSSVVRAGLLPSLASGALPGSSAWSTAVVRPGQLTHYAAESVDLLVIDQAEELFTTDVTAQQIAAIEGMVADLLARGARVVLVIRADFYGRLAELPDLAPVVGSATELVPAMTESELQRVITEPAARIGAGVEPELVEQVLADIRGQAGALPMLSVALQRTWQKRQGNTMTLGAYAQAGGVHRALEATAEDALLALSAERREEARRLLVRMAARRGQSWVRRPLNRGDVESSVLASATTVELLANGRLVTLTTDRIELVHEALLEHWPRLRKWLEEWAAVAELAEGVSAAARTWDLDGRQDTDLLRGPRLQTALEWASADPDEVSALEHDYLTRSDEAAQGDLAAARERADREARGRRRLRYVVSALAAATVAASVGIVIATRERTAQQQAALSADARRVAAESLIAPDLRTSLLLAAAAYRLQPSNDSRGALLSALERSGSARWRITTAGRNNFLGVDAAGQNLWTMDTERLIYRYDVATRRVVATFPSRADTVSAVSPDGRQLVDTGQQNYFDTAGIGRVNVLDAQTGHTISVLPVTTTTDVGQQAAFTADGRWLAVVQAGAGAGSDGGGPSSPTVAVFDTTDYQTGPRRIHFDSPIQSLATGRDRLAVVTSKGTVYVVRARDLHVLASARRSDLAEAATGGPQAELALAPDARHLAVTTPANPTLPYLLDTGHLAAQPRVLEHVDGGVGAMSFSPTGARLAVSGRDGAVTLFHVGDASVLARPLSAAPGQAAHLAWSGSADRDTGLYAAGRDGQLISLDVTTGARLVHATGPAVGDPVEVFRSGTHLVRVGDTVVTGEKASVPITVTTLEGQHVLSAALAIDPKDTPQGLSLDAAADRALMITQDPHAIMHSTVFALPSANIITQFIATGTPSRHNNDIGVISADGRTAAYALTDHSLAVYSMPDGRRLRTFDVHFTGVAGDRHLISPFAFAPDGRLLVIGLDTLQSSLSNRATAASHGPPEDQLVGIVNLRTGHLDGEVGGFGEQGVVDAVAWSADRARVAIGTLAGTLRVVDARTFAPTSPAVHAVAGVVQSVSFSPDGNTVVTGGDDGRLTFWDATTLTPIGVAVRGLREDDSWWAFYRSDGTLTGYTPAAAEGTEQWFTLPARPGDWLSAACRLAGDQLTRAEWTQAVGAKRRYQRVCLGP